MGARDEALAKMDQPLPLEPVVPRLGPPVTPRVLWDLAVRTVRDAMDDRVIGLAAEVAFFALFALPPTLLAFLGAAGWIGDALGPDVANRIVQHVVASSATFLTPQTVEAVVAPTIAAIMERGRADVFSIGVVFALWSASRSAYVVIEALLIAYDLELDRSLWRRRVQALGFTITGLVLASIMLPLVVVGPRFGASITAPLGLSSQFATMWRVLYWPLVGGLTIALLTAIYHYSIPWRTPFRRDLPGAVLALVLWVIAALGLRTYVTWALLSDSVYGSLGAPIALMLWLYCTAFAVLMGAELNAEIEKLWPTVTVDEKWAAWAEATGAAASRRLADGGDDDADDERDSEPDGDGEPSSIPPSQ